MKGSINRFGSDERVKQSSLVSSGIDDEFNVEDYKSMITVPVDHRVTDNLITFQDHKLGRKKKMEGKIRLLNLDKKGEPFNSDQKKKLDQQGFPDGIIRVMEEYMTEFALRIWIVDNSRSMNKGDGHRVIEHDDDEHSAVGGDNHHNCNKIEIMPCSRWEEMQDTVMYHATMAALLKAPTIFRLLNEPGRKVGPQVFGVADKWSGLADSDLDLAKKVMSNAKPTGASPLCGHMIYIRDQLALLRPELDKYNKKVSVTIATDGIPTDETYYGQFVKILASMKDLPVVIHIRLITDDEIVVNYYRAIDSKIDQVVGVLDDYLEEANKVEKYNSWLNYILPLYRLSEMGCGSSFQILNKLNKQKLKEDEVKEFCDRMFILENMPHDFESFASNVIQQTQTIKYWNPKKNEATTIIDEEKFETIYGQNPCVIC